MATINALNNPLTSSTGTGNFAGSNGAVFTGNVDASGASEFVTPSSSSPSLSVTGQIAVDDSVPGYPGLINYYSGSEVLIGLGMLEADLVATNNYVIKYNSASSKFTMAAQSGGSTGKLTQYVVATSTANDVTTSSVLSNTSLTASITPQSSTSKILIMCSGYSSGQHTGSGSQNSFRSGTFSIRRTTQTAADLTSNTFGRFMQTSALTTALPSYSQVSVSAYETSGSTALHTYVLRYSSPFTTTNSCSLRGDLSPATMIIMELAP